MPEDDFLGFDGRRVLVTGGSGGIGASVATHAARQGAVVAVSGRNRDRLDALVDSLPGPGHVAIVADLTDPDAAGGLIAGAAEALGGIDVVVHAAGVHSARPLKSIDAAHVASVLETNVTSALMLAKAFRDRRIPKRDASLVLMSSVVATVGQPGVSAYAASKGAVSALTRSLALELARDGIRVNAVEAGIVDTPMTDDIRGTVGDSAFALIEAAHPLGIGTADDVALAVLFLSSHASRWMTGTSLVVDGGYTAH